MQQVSKYYNDFNVSMKNVSDEWELFKTGKKAKTEMP